MEITNIDQSKALLESGLKRESADLWWVQRYVAEWDTKGNLIQHCVVPVTYLSFVNDGLYNMSQDKVVATPAWSLGKLLGMFKSGEDRPTFTLTKGGTDVSRDKHIDDWFAEYENECDGEKSFWYCENDESVVGAVVKLILKLKKEGVEI